jgi:hypothetical protein
MWDGLSPQDAKKKFRERGIVCSTLSSRDQEVDKLKQELAEDKKNK